MDIVVTMTSWEKRINYVGKAIYRFLTTQSILPTFFYLWLSEEEFQNKEKSLPKDLLLICKKFNIKICWIKQNEYCHKRWYVFPKHYNDLVISIDDDVFYDSSLIETAINYSRLYKNTVINIGTPEYHPLKFNNSISREFDSYILDTQIKNMQFCGQSIILPNSFPLEVVDEKNIKIRKKYCKKCDESFITPFLVKNKTSFIAHRWNNKVDKNLQENAMSIEMKNKKDLQIYLVLKLYKDCMTEWKKLYKNYNTSNFDHLTIDEISASL